MFCVPKKLSRNIAFCIWIVCTFPKIVLKVSTDCVRCPKKTFLRIVCSVFLSEDCVRLNLLVCLFTKIVLKASRDCVLCPNKTFFLSEYCFLYLNIVFSVRRLCSTQFVGLSVSEDCVAPLGRLPGPATPLTLTWPQTPNGTQFFWHWPQKRGAYITRLSGQIIWFNSHCVKKNFYYAPIQLWTMELWTQLLWDSNQW